MKPMEQLLEIMARLRDTKNGCPWDLEQDFASIAPHTLEEAYEVVDAIEKKDMQGLREELGDLLLQVVFHAQMAEEKNLFTFEDVAQGICDKLISRHPHVYGGAKVKDAAGQAEAWEQQKSEEKKKAGFVNHDPLADVPFALPALVRAQKLQKRAARVGFDWANLEAIFEKLDEEIQELMHVMAHDNTPEGLEEEMGDILFCCVNIARKLNVDAEKAVRFCNRKFVSRLGYVRAELNVQHRNLSDASLQELNDLWDQAKIAEHMPPRASSF